jgi:hypothetical protein
LVGIVLEAVRGRKILMRMRRKEPSEQEEFFRQDVGVASVVLRNG